MSASSAARSPVRHSLVAAGVAIRQQLRAEWRSTPFHRWGLSRSRPEGLGAAPRDLRPADLENAQRIMAGAFVMAGATLTTGPRGDPWDRPSPDRAFATALHRMGWLRDLTALGDRGAVEGLRLVLEWRRTFGRWNSFAWGPEVLERRVFNLACALRAICARASDAERGAICLDLARQARFLLQGGEGPSRAAERACAAAVAAGALSGRGAERLLTRALLRLEQALVASVDADGGHASRSPQAALELLFDLRTLDDVLVQRGVVAPSEVMRAIDRLASAVRFFTLADGRLAAFQGGEELLAPYVAAARALDDADGRAVPGARNGYQRLEGPSLQVMADAAPPSEGAWSVTACAQPLAIEVLAGARRLIVGGGWSPDAQGPQAMRVVDAASTASLGDAACGEPLRGFAAQVLGPRLADAYDAVEARRHESPGALWLEMAHDGWLKRFGLRHERRLYLDLGTDELRGEDSFVALAPSGRTGGRKFVPFMVRFHLHPDVSALIARDRKSVLLKAEGQDQGWWLRNDAIEVDLEPSLYYQGGQARRAQQIVLRGQARLETGAKIRWKLSAAQAAAPVGDLI